MSVAKKDILLLGATGYSGRLTAAYLLKHADRSNFTLQIAGRSKSKLAALTDEFKRDNLPLDGVDILEIDVTDDEQLERAVKGVRVIINTVGPFWLWGTPVVRACARNGVHYVDITGEWHWVHQMIQEYDFVATKTGAIIVPCCGFDSIPGDLTAYTSVRTLQAHDPSLTAGDSITAYKVKGSVSGGTISTAISFVEDVPRWRIRESSRPYALSPVSGRKAAWPQFFYSLPSNLSNIQGGYWAMRNVNSAIVRRTWGLFQLNAIENPSDERSVAPYGPDFLYDEFLQTPTKLAAFTISSMVFLSTIFILIAPLRWVVKKFLPAAGTGPAPEDLEKRSFTLTNITSSVASPGKPQVHVQTILKGRGDPGYLVTSIFLAEAALTLLPPSYKNLTALAKRGGVLTPMSALGEVFIEKMKKTGRIEIDSRIVTERAGADGKKTV